MKKLVIWDIESLPNIFTLRAKVFREDRMFTFEISERTNDLTRLKAFIQILVKGGYEMVGYNSLCYDYPVLHEILFARPEIVTPSWINKVSRRVIGDNSMGGFGQAVWGARQVVPQWDLYLIHHFNNSARRTSLKAIEFWQRSLNIDEFECDFNAPLELDKFDRLIEYNGSDVIETEKFLEYSMGAIELRVDLMRNSKQDMRWHNNGKIGKQIFIELIGYTNCFTKVDGKWIPRGTPRDKVDLGELMSPLIECNVIPQFKAVKQFFSEQVVTGTKGVFDPKVLEIPDYLTDYMHHEVTATVQARRDTIRIYESSDNPSDATYPPRMNAFLQRYKKGKLLSSDTLDGKLENMNIEHDGLVYVFGTGGLHASRQKEVYKASDEYGIYDWDFTAYYPSLARLLGLCPAHFKLEDWIRVNLEIWNRRQSYKKGTAAYAAYKEAGNIPYGLSGFPESPFYDIAYMLGICINGQMLLMSLIERLIIRTGAKIIQANTDGVTFKIKRSLYEDSQEVAREFEAPTKGVLLIEEAEYETMYIRNVNNYIATDIDGKVKAKGFYEVDKLPHKDTSQLIVQKAILANVKDGTEIEDTIYGCKDPFDFFKRVKGKIDGYAGKVLRYYCATEGEDLLKLNPKNNVTVEKSTKCRVMQRVPEGLTILEDLDYEYYVEQAYKFLQFKEID